MSKRLLLMVVCACGSPSADLDLPIGEIESDLANWGSALDCKPIPDVPELVSPRMVVSLEGLTLHLIDEAAGYDRVFPIGGGSVEMNEEEPSYGESLSYYPILATAGNDFELRKSRNVACKTWWTDPETGERKPVFAGLPFMPFYGAYAIHGPIDNFTAANGGNLYRGFVSHGCIRMEAADVLEVYARVGRLSEVPVRVQREPERAADGTRIDVTNKWIGAECTTDLDCTYEGGFCHGNAIGGRGFCSKRCTAACPDRAHTPVTFCVADPDDPAQGMCTLKVSARNDSCRPQDHMRPRVVKRFKSSVSATVCMPASRGWIGDRCHADNDCQQGNTCNDGLCTQPCSRLCPDQPGTPWTTCVAGHFCARQCTNGDECAAGTTCQAKARASDPSKTKTVCL